MFNGMENSNTISNFFCGDKNPYLNFYTTKQTKFQGDRPHWLAS